MTREELISLVDKIMKCQGSKSWKSFQIPDQEKERQEKESLNNVDDSFKKIVLVRDVVKTSRDEKGIVTMSIYDFLMNKNSLETC